MRRSTLALFPCLNEYGRDAKYVGKDRLRHIEIAPQFLNGGGSVNVRRRDLPHHAAGELLGAAGTKQIASLSQ